MVDTVNIIGNFWMPSTINVLGEEYTIKLIKASEDYANDPDAKKLVDNGLTAYEDGYEKKIVISSLDDPSYHPQFVNVSDKAKISSIKESIRHEIIHAFLDESGLKSETDSKDIPWQRNEVCIDWFAIQSPKICMVFMDCGLL